MRLDGYVRVSQRRGRAGDSFISPTLQRERIQAWCQAHGHELVEVHEEIDAPAGAGRRREKFDRMLARVIGGEVDGVVVYKASRFGRSFRESVNHIYEVRDAGGVIAAVSERLDTSTRGGRLGLNIFLSIAEDQLDEIRQGWRDAKRKAVARGVHPSAVAPFGYRREPQTGGRLLVDPHTGPLVTEVFRRRAEGEGLTALGRWLGDQGARTVQGRTRFSLRAVRDIVRNRVYLGIAYADGVENPDAHEPLTDHDTFRRAQRPGVAAVPTGVAGAAPVVRPLLRCAGCRYAVRAERRLQKRGEVWLFSCRSRSRDGSWDCDTPVHLSVVDGELDDLVAGRFIAGLPALTRRVQALVPGLERLEREEARQQALLVQWRDDPRVQERLGMDAYLAGLEARQHAHREAADAVVRARAAAGVPVLPAESASVGELWPTLSDEERRKLLRAGLLCVFIRGRHSGGLALGDRVRLVWRDEAVRLPARGDREFVAHPFDFGGGGDGDGPGVGGAVEQDPGED